MASPSIAAYFNVRKRAATDDISNNKNKVIRLEDNGSPLLSAAIENHMLIKNKIGDEVKDSCIVKSTNQTTTPNSAKAKDLERKVHRRGLKRNHETDKEKSLQPKIVKFTLGGTLSPKKNHPDAKNVFQSKSTNSAENSPIPKPDQASGGSEAKPSASAAASKGIILNNLVSNAKKDQTYEEIKAKVGRSSRLQELKAMLQNRKQLEEQLQACVQKRHGKLQPGQTKSTTEGVALQKFDTIELEVLSSPQKGLRTPTKNAPPQMDNYDKNDIMSPKKDAVVKRLFSPSKAAIPAYQRFQSLTETSQSTLPLPYKYRCLSEVFRCVESICSMYHNRKETITFKKLKPGVQRLLRKNFTEKHLAQIKYIYPDAYSFEQRKMLNPGSHTKYDYYQLVIIPNIQPKLQTEIQALLDEDNIMKQSENTMMNPQIIIARQQKFNQILLDRVKEEHEIFLKGLDVSVNIPKDNIRRWHQEFDLEACPDILPGELPQPPNIEKFSSAKDILSTARNLFNCATPMERMMSRYEAAGDAASDALSNSPDSILGAEKPQADDPLSRVLKSIPKSLLEKIRAKQAAKAFDAITRRPSQDLEASNFSRLPELARHIRNIFVTENKGVLELEKVLTKLENSYREKLPRDTFKELLELMAKEAPRNWLSFHYIRKTDFIKINRNANLTELMKELEQKAQEKAQ